MKNKKISFVYFAFFLGCLAAGIYLQEGRARLLLDYRTLVLIPLAFILSTLLFGGTKTTALAYFDAYTEDVFDDRIGRYGKGLDLIKRAGRLLFLWGGIGVLVGLFILVNNLDKAKYIGSSVYFANSCVLMVFVWRALFVHPAAIALEDKIAGIENKSSTDPVYLQHDKISPWIYLLLLFLLPVIGVGFFLILGANVSIFLIPGAAVIVPLSALFSCAAGAGFKKMAAAFGISVDKNPHTRYEIDRAAGILRRLGWICIEMGAAGFVIKLIIMLTVLEDPEAIFGQFILGLVPVFYGIYIAAALCFPLVNRLKFYRESDKVE